MEKSEIIEILNEWNFSSFHISRYKMPIRVNDLLKTLYSNKASIAGADGTKCEIRKSSFSTSRIIQM
jgi:hypothetical protein